MHKFIKAYKDYIKVKQYGDYRFCWIPIDEKGNGIYSTIEFFDEEIEKIDIEKCELLII